jgi:hypothetical protein
MQTVQTLLTRLTTTLAELGSAIELESQARAQDILRGALASLPPRRGQRQARGAKSTPARRLLPAKGKGKRSADDIAAFTAKILAAIKRKPGCKVNELADAVGTGTKDLALPIKKLLADKSISKRGQRRATRYFSK